MLHEILLSLSGHPSALFDSSRDEGDLTTASFPLLSRPEAELLSNIKRLAQLHRLVRAHTSRISSSHPFTICRAVATAITSVHLAKFQQKILDVESQILRKDAKSVGAYNIVPLASVVGEFEEWTRLMEWLWDLSCYMMLPKEQRDVIKSKAVKNGVATGAGIIDKLRLETQTGFPEIEEAAVSLGKVAETSWLRQLSSWLLYGRIPAFGTADFFVQAEEHSGQELPAFQLESRLLPKFVSQRTASSILFIGKSLNHISAHRNTLNAQGAQPSATSHLELLPVHLEHLSKIETPISSAGLSEAVLAIRISLSRNLLHELLPLSTIIESLSLFQEFFLLGRGEFAVALISEADEWKRARSQRAGQGKQVKEDLRSILVKEGDVAAVLMRTWAALSAISSEQDATDSSTELARDLIHIIMSQAADARPATPGRARDGTDSLPKISNVMFNDLLFSVPTKLTMDIRSPIDLFISSSELDVYSSIHAYLLAIRRAHLRLTDLWRQSSIRRDHPGPPGPPLTCTPSGQRIARMKRERAYRRGVEMRKVWATCGAAVFLLSETGAYLEGEVIQSSWKHFRNWIVGASDTDDADASESQRKSALHDPETLASAHRAFLAALAHSLLLTDSLFTRSLQNFVSHIDELVAFIHRLQIIQTNLDLEEDEGVVDALTSYQEEELDVSLELDRARKRVDSDMKALIGRLREVDSERVGVNPFAPGVAAEDDIFEPWKEGGVDRLLMKLDFGRLAGEDEFDDGVEDS